MKPFKLDIVVLGLSITSSWGNGHATTYRCLLRGLWERGHRITFLERETPWYAENRDQERFPYSTVNLYSSLDELRNCFGDLVRSADLVIVGSFVPDGALVGDWVLEQATGVAAFYDIDTPVTLEKLKRGSCDYLRREQMPKYHLYLSFTGGPMLRELEARYGARCARALYCAVDADHYVPRQLEPKWDLAFLGTYSEDRQGPLETLLFGAARACNDLGFAVAGSMYPNRETWPDNVESIEHIPPSDHATFYNSQRFTLNITRPQMIRAGFSPSVRMFEAAGCGTPILTDWWPGLQEFFVPGQEILVVESPRQVVQALREMREPQRQSIAQRARDVTLRQHTGQERARQLEGYYLEALRYAPGRVLSITN